MPQPLTDAINALTAYANTVTGQNDPDLSSAVATLASGWSNSGSSSGYTPNPNKPLTSAIESLTYYANSVTGASDQTLSEAVATLANGYNTWKVVITSDQLSYQKGNSTNYSGTPHYTAASTKRVSYAYFDIPIEYGYIYKFDFVTTLSDAYIGPQFFNTYVQGRVNSHSNFTNANIYQPGWLVNGSEVEPPEKYNNYNIVGVRFTFKGNNADTYNFSNGSLEEIESVTITRRPTT